MTIRIAIVDDHPMIINGLQNMLSGYPHISVIGCYEDGAELLDGLEQEQPDVLLLDIQLPGKTGDELVPVLLEKYPGMHILALTNFNNPVYIQTMQRLGVLGYLLKTTRRDTLIRAIETVSNGELFLEPSLRDKIGAEAVKFNKNIYASLALTRREKEILNMLVKGYSNKEIAEKLFRSYHTVRNYRASIFNKLDVVSISELIKKAQEAGLV